jgi:hypothetical protein
VHHEKTLDFSEIVENEPFTKEGRITTFADLDGVFFKYGKESNYEENVKRLHALAKVISKSDEFVYWSSRIRIEEESFLWKGLGPLFDGKSVSYFPFMTGRSVDRLERFAKTINPDCEVSSKIGLNKMKSCIGVKDDFMDMAKDSLKKGNKLVVIGSSIIDRHRIRQLSEELKSKQISPESLFYFDTGHFIL